MLRTQRHFVFVHLNAARMPCCLPFIKRTCWQRGKCVKRVFLLCVLMPPVCCCGWSCGIQGEKYSKPYHFSNHIFGIGTSGLFEGEVTKRQHWSGHLLSGKKNMISPKQIISTYCKYLYYFYQQICGYKVNMLPSAPDVIYSVPYLGYTHEINYLSWEEATFEGCCICLLSGGCSLIKSERLSVKPIPNWALFISASMPTMAAHKALRHGRDPTQVQKTSCFSWLHQCCRKCRSCTCLQSSVFFLFTTSPLPFAVYVSAFNLELSIWRAWKGWH